MNRRDVLKSGLLGVAAAVSASLPVSDARAQSREKPTILMVHGSWHWGGCFQKIANLLAAKGYPALTPDLTSHGFDPAPYDSIANMEQYAAPVEEILQKAQAPIVLVGHSMGGVTLSYLGEKYPEKIRALIYLCAFMVPNGKRALDYVLLNEKIPQAAELFKIVSQVNEGRGLKLDLTDRALVKAAFYGGCSDHDISIAANNLLAIQTTVPDSHISAVTAQRYGTLRRVYIECTDDKAIPIETQRRMIEEAPGAKVVTLQTSHSPFFSQPGALARVLMDHAG
jgi:pimeloyl-ACP methyl ester carboxylesterase